WSNLAYYVVNGTNVDMGSTFVQARVPAYGWIYNPYGNLKTISAGSAATFFISNIPMGLIRLSWSFASAPTSGNISIYSIAMP
ncbi:MAG TPA: hypothetical protein VF941_07290, partial [Clostridia bacterium]